MRINGKNCALSHLCISGSLTICVNGVFSIRAKNNVTTSTAEAHTDRTVWSKYKTHFTIVPIYTHIFFIWLFVARILFFILKMFVFIWNVVYWILCAHFSGLGPENSMSMWMKRVLWLFCGLLIINIIKSMWPCVWWSVDIIYLGINFQNQHLR